MAYSAKENSPFFVCATNAVAPSENDSLKHSNTFPSPLIAKNINSSLILSQIQRLLVNSQLLSLFFI